LPLNSVQKYVHGLIDGLAVPWDGIPAVTAYITPPAPGAFNGPIALIAGARMQASRETMPRGAGFKNLVWTVEVYLHYQSPPTAPDLDQVFPIIVDAVMVQMWTTKMPLKIADPTTGYSSATMSVGERFTLDYPPVRTANKSQTYVYVARIQFEVKELLQA
jgi:hypothetical protein